MTLTVGGHSYIRDASQPALPTIIINKLCQLSCSLFRTIAMAGWYVNAKVDLLAYEWQWFSSSIRYRHLYVRCSYIAGIKTLKECLTSAISPIPKKQFHSIGRKQGLRITRDIVWYPSGGLCLGMSLDFLSKYFLQSEGTSQEKSIQATLQLKREGNLNAVKIQSLYNALLGEKGHVNNKHLNYYRSLLKKEPCVKPADLNKDLLNAVDSILLRKDRCLLLRKAIFDDLEGRGVEITPSIYALTLELDVLWTDDKQNKYGEINKAVIQSAAELLRLIVKDRVYLSGKIASVCEQIQSLDDGGYLIHFSNHTVSLIKNGSHCEVFDPNRGLGLFAAAEAADGITYLLHYYDCDVHIELNLSKVE